MNKITKSPLKKDKSFSPFAWLQTLNNSFRMIESCYTERRETSNDLYTFDF